MKRKLQIIISASAASVLALSVLAQDTPNSKTDGTEYGRDRTPQERRADQLNGAVKSGLRTDGNEYGQDRTPQDRRADQLNGAVKSSDVIGMTVNNYQNEKLGKVEDLAVDVESGRIVQVILSTGGFLGIGDTLTAVPPGALHHDIAQKVLHLDANKEKLQNAPKFEMSKWADYSDSDLSGVYRHYGEESAFNFIQRGDALRDGQGNNQSMPNTTSARKADGTWDKDRVSNDRQSQWMIPATRLGQVQKASKLIGTPVNNRQDEKLGKVENLLVDLSSGRVVAIIVSSGGFLGMGDELSAIPPTALGFTADRATLQLDASKETLSSAPHFKANQWPDFAQPSYVGGVYRAHKVEPYFTSTATTDNTARNVRDRNNGTKADVNTKVEPYTSTATTEPDNTARNVRDRSSRTLTPLNQGNSKADVSTTAQIRKEILAKQNMTTNAKNVKIITLDGRVTLRGPVNTAEEKRLIGEIAERIAHSENVDNQLEVKPTTSSNY